MDRSISRTKPDSWHSVGKTKARHMRNITRDRSGRAAQSRDSSVASWRLHTRSEREGAQADRGRFVTFPADDGCVERQAASRSSEAAG